MRKYKDVCKRILGLVLTICMLSTLVMEVPVYAADLGGKPDEVDFIWGPDSNGAVWVNGTKNSFIYSGREIRPEIKIQVAGKDLTENTDYILDYRNNTNHGTAYIDVTGLGAYAWSFTETFTIEQQALEFIGVRYHGVSGVDKECYVYYSGKDELPIIDSVYANLASTGTQINLSEKDYTISYTANANTSIGEHSFKVELNPNGNYKYADGYTPPVKLYKIWYNLGSDTVKVTGLKDSIYNGNTQQPTFSLTDDYTGSTIPKDNYSVSWKENTNVGTATLTVTADNRFNYRGSKSFTFSIGKADLKGDNVVVSIADEKYYYIKGGAPDMSGKVDVTINGNPVPQSNFMVSYLGPAGVVGRNVLKIEGVDNLMGSVNKEFYIYDKLGKITLSKAELEYTGETLVPEITVKNEAGETVDPKNYTVKYFSDEACTNEVSEPKNIGKYYIQVEGAESDGRTLYEGTLTAGYGIIAKSLDKCRFNLLINNENSQLIESNMDLFGYYDGERKVLSLTATDDKGNALKEGTDFSYRVYRDKDCTDEADDLPDDPSQDLINVGIYYIKATGDNNYAGSEKVFTYTIKPKAIKPVANGITVKEQTYTGTAVVPSADDIIVTYKDGNGRLQTITGAENIQVVSCSNNTEIGNNTANVFIKLKGNYVLDASASNQGKFSIVPRKINECDIRYTEEFAYNGLVQKPVIRVIDGTKSLEEGKDFTVAFFSDSAYTTVIQEPVDAGTYYILITGLENYRHPDGSAKKEFKIVRKKLESLTVTVDNMPYAEGAPVVPTIQVTDGAATLVPDKDYEIDGYFADEKCTIPSEHKDAGKVFVRIKATDTSNYEGTATAFFFIGDRLSDLVDPFDVTGGTYDKTNHHDALIAAIKEHMSQKGYDDGYAIQLFSDPDCTKLLSDADDPMFVNAGTIYFKVFGSGKYYGSVSGKAIIAKKNIAELDAEVHGTFIYNGLEQSVGIATKPGVEGVILQYPGTNGYILNSTPDVIEYMIVSSANATNAGTATITLKAADNSNYTGTKTVEYTILPMNLNVIGGAGNLELTVAETVFSNEVKTPAVTLIRKDNGKVLEKNVDYRYLVYKDETYTSLASNQDLINATNATRKLYVKVFGIGNYTGELATADCENKYGSNEFVINPFDITNAVDVDIEGKHYFFSNNIPEFHVVQEFAHGAEVYEYELKAGADFTYTPTSISKFGVGKQKLTITGQGNFTGTRNSFFFYDGNLSNSANQIEVIMSQDVVAYNQAEADADGMKPGDVTVYIAGTNPQEKLTLNTDYKISYINNKVPGKASVVISGVDGGNWVGSYTADFTITGNIADSNITKIEVPTQPYTGIAYSPDGQKINGMKVVCGGRTLVENVDYRITAINNAQNVTATKGASVTIEGLTKYFNGEQTKNFDIKYDMSKKDFVIDIGNGTFTYTGSEIRPTAVVKYFTTDTTYDPLIENVDYTVSYQNNIEVAPANGQNGPCVVITATPDGRLMGTTKAQEFSIASINLADYEIFGVKDSYMYTGKMIKPQFEVRKKGNPADIIAPENYTITYASNDANPSEAPAGSTVTITVIGKGNYDGVIEKTFTVVPRDLKNDATAAIENQIYCGEEIRPEIKFTFNDENGVEQTLKIGRDYRIVEYANNINAAEAGKAYAPYVMVQGVGSCTSTAFPIEFTIEQKAMEDLIYTAVENPQYEPGKTKYEPAVDAFMLPTSTEPLEKDVVYTVSYKNNDKVAAENGTTGPYILFTAKDSNFKGSKTIPFAILARDIDSETIIGSLSDASDTGFDPVTRNYPFKAGAVYTPLLTLTDNSGEIQGVKLNEGSDYTITYSANNNQVGTAFITVTGKGNYEGTRTEKFTIGTLLCASSITVTGIEDKVYNGLDTTPTNIQVKFNQSGEMLIPNDDYQVKYYTDEKCLIPASAVDMVHAGTIYVAIIGSESPLTGYVGTVVIPYEITRKSLTSPDIEVVGNNDMDYTGSELNPVLTLKDTTTGKIIDSTQYTVKYENNIEIGTATATITATETGNYKDSKTIYYNITKHNIDKVTADAIPDQNYTGNYIIPDVALYDNGVKLVNGVDYIVTNGNNLRAGESWVIIQGLGNYDGTKRVYFNIIAGMEQAIVDDIEDQLYTGQKIEPKITIACGGNTLVEGTDYKVIYANNVALGDASATIIPLTKYYTGTVVKKFRITNSLTSAKVTGIPESVLYNGSAITPVPVVSIGSKTLTPGVDYTVTYKNNVKVGTASVVITGKGIYSGTKTVTFKITEKSINNCTIYAVASQFYTGRPQTPPVVVKDGTTALVENRDYVLSYSNNINIGTATVNITGCGDYKGAVKKTFAIVEQKAVTNVLIQNKNVSTGTFDVVIDGVANYVTKVQVPVWTKADQSDIVWYNATRVDVDTFIVHVDKKNHKNNVGVYNIHVYTSGVNRPSKIAYTTTTTCGVGFAYKWVTMGANSFTIGNSARLYYATNENARVTVQIYYGNNAYMKTLESNKSIGTNDQVAIWDLKDANGNYVENGIYRFTITALDATGKKIIQHKWFEVTGNQPFAFKRTNLVSDKVSIGNEAKLSYATNKDAKVTVQIYYGNNSFLKTLQVNKQVGTDDQIVTWDLKDAYGNYVESGTYRFTITAQDATGKKITEHRWFQVTGRDPFAYKWVTTGKQSFSFGDTAKLYYATNQSSNVTVRVFYGNNNFLKTLDSNKSIGTNDQVAIWDLRDASGNYVESGTYRFTITATDASGKTITQHRWFQVKQAH